MSLRLLRGMNVKCGLRSRPQTITIHDHLLNLHNLEDQVLDQDQVVNHNRHHHLAEQHLLDCLDLLSHLQQQPNHLEDHLYNKQHHNHLLNPL